MKVFNNTNSLEWQLRLMILGGSISEYLKVISEIGIIDFLSKEPKKINDFINEKNFNSDKLKRLMRIGVSLNLFEKNDSEEFSLTEMGKLLELNGHLSLRNYAILKGQKWGRTALTGLKDSLYQEDSAFELIHGTGIFDFMERENISHQYHESLSDISKYHDSNIIKSYNFSNSRRVMDIGGGMGSLLAAILNSNPELKGVHFDQKSASEKAKNTISKALHERCDFVYGDFFKKIPEVCDLYILKTILHDWDDTNASKILNNIRKVIPNNGKMLIIEILPKDNNNEYNIMDLEMLIFYGGKERTKKEYDDLLASTGFKIQRVIPTDTDISILEVIPV